MTDVYFVPEADAVAQDITPGDEPVAITEHFISLDIHETLTPVRRRFNKGLPAGGADRPEVAGHGPHLHPQPRVRRHGARSDG